MGRLTKLEIQRALLTGQEIAWTSAAGKRETITLGDPAQRRLFHFLLQSNNREAKGLSDHFVTELSNAHSAINDPAENHVTSDMASLTGPWRLQQIETEGFGGLNTY